MFGVPARSSRVCLSSSFQRGRWWRAGRSHIACAAPRTGGGATCGRRWGTGRPHIACAALPTGGGATRGRRRRTGRSQLARKGRRKRIWDSHGNSLLILHCSRPSICLSAHRPAILRSARIALPESFAALRLRRTSAYLGPFVTHNFHENMPLLYHKYVFKKTIFVRLKIFLGLHPSRYPKSDCYFHRYFRYFFPAALVP